MRTAKFIRLLDYRIRGVAALYEVTPPHDGHTHIVASSAANECYLFQSNPQGDIVSYSELTGSQRGTMNHSHVFGGLGYEIC